MTSTITLRLPNSPEMRLVLRQISDRCFESHARRSRPHDEREAWLRVGSEILVGIDPDQLVDDSPPPEQPRDEARTER